MGVIVATTTAEAAPRGVTVFLQRNGQVVEHDGEDISIPKYGGGDRAWNSIVTCVKQQFSPFQIEIVDQRPSGEFITAVVGGKASLLGLDDRSTNGVGAYSPGRVIRDAVVHVFSRVGTGESDVSNLCSVTVHEVSHALGLDHTYKCGDVMSYFLDRCGTRRFMDVDAPCGEDDGPRLCGDGANTQNSYRKVAEAVGLRNQPQDPEPEPEPVPEPDDTDDPSDPWGQPADDSGTPADPYAADDEPPAPPPRHTHQPRTAEGQRTTVRGSDGRLYTVEQVRGRHGERWIIVRRAR